MARRPLLLLPPADDWTQVQNRIIRRRMQNRVAQRNHHKEYCRKVSRLAGGGHKRKEADEQAFSKQALRLQEDQILPASSPLQISSHENDAAHTAMMSYADLLPDISPPDLWGVGTFECEQLGRDETRFEAFRGTSPFAAGYDAMAGKGASTRVFDNKAVPLALGPGLSKTTCATANTNLIGAVSATPWLWLLLLDVNFENAPSPALPEELMFSYLDRNNANIFSSRETLHQCCSSCAYTLMHLQLPLCARGSIVIPRRTRTRLRLTRTAYILYSAAKKKTKVREKLEIIADVSKDKASTGKDLVNSPELCVRVVAAETKSISQPAPMQPFPLPLLQLSDKHSTLCARLPAENNRFGGGDGVADGAETDQAYLVVPMMGYSSVGTTQDHNSYDYGCDYSCDYNCTQDNLLTQGHTSLRAMTTYSSLIIQTPSNTAVSSPALTAMSTLNNTAVPVLDLDAMHRIAELARHRLVGQSPAIWDEMAAKPPTRQQ
ncbi:hypothetical protein COCMIDRAFT_29262 [Bipolaris oryzae ATCC 44560]|uniref:BZIP domain-containing protein n=1 Tax=Bipolaris oryzae ATCC 44560 TaxID=930090 RepID=W6YRK1_COCMI|nr:uncharacterized protein COCMIDRAFT_29262 [Bipolaris oryzae ATCC 44560]EUC42082.1 hypothetical protein COCMIDRAFT_29262 [Bipolaris oryzae ATCC 44560]